MEKKRPQLNLDELYQLKWALGGALAVLSAWTVLYMDVDGWLWLALITLAAPVATRWPTLTLRVPRWAHRLAFPLIVAVLAGDFYFNREPLPAMIRLAMMLVLYRSVTARKRRDDLQLIILGLFLVVVAGVLSVSLIFAVQIVVFTGCALLFLMLINLIDAAETGRPAAEFSAASPPAWMRTDWRRLASRLREAIDWRVALLSAGLFGGVVTLSALLFIALPRFDIANGFFLDELITRQAKSGFSENVRFGDVTDIRRDTGAALHVEVDDRRAIPSELYWRMLVLDDYKDGVFSMSTELGDQIRRQRLPAAHINGGSRPRAGDAVWTFYLEPGTARYLPLLGTFNQLKFGDGPQDYAVNDELRLLRLEKVPPKMFAYRVTGMRIEEELGEDELVQPREAKPPYREASDKAGKRELSPAPMPDFLKTSLQPGDLAKVAEWARTLADRAGDAKAFARAACEWLASRHGYSLQTNLPPGPGDPLVRWLDSGAPGHCELFAGAFTLLARSAGFPARVVTGFHGGSWNEGGNHLTVRNSDAHAWCEIFDAAGRRWVRVDPTPGAPLPGQVAAKESSEVVLARIRDRSWNARLDALRMFWYRRIVDFDQNSQAELARDAKNALQSYAKKLKDALDERARLIGEWLRRPLDSARWQAWLCAVGAVAVVLGLGWFYRARVRWPLPRGFGGTRGVDPVRREAGRWLRKLDMRGRVNGGERAAVRAELERLRYGPAHGWPSPQGVFRRAKRVCAGR